MAAGQPPSGYFDILYKHWLAREIRSKRVARIAALAFHKDMQVALRARPTNLEQILPQDFEFRVEILRLWEDSIEFVTNKLLRVLPKRHDQHTVVVSPWAGGSHASEVTNRYSGSSGSVYNLRICCLNPGRLGFSDQSGAVLWWRLWEIAAYGIENSVQIFVCPGPRLPEGVNLPQGFPYCIVGDAMASYDSVLLLVSVDFTAAFEILEDLSSSPRRIWCKVRSLSLGSLAFCGFYGPPMGDHSFFRDMVAEGQQVGTYVAIGDANIHPQDLVEHDRGCTCSHCKPSAVDKKCVACLRHAGLTCRNPKGKPTHDSKTSVDQVWATEKVPHMEVEVGEPGCVGGSDHAPVTASFSVQLHAEEGASVSKVAWLTSREWDVHVAFIDPLLLSLAHYVDMLALCPSLIQDTKKRSQIKKRRALLDAVVWMRNLWYTMLGHLAGLVSVALPRQSECRFVKDIEPSHAECDMWSQYKSQWARYTSLRAADPNAASRALSSILGPPSPFILSLSDPDSGDPLSPEQTIDSILQDLLQRPQSASSCIPLHAARTQRLVSEIRAANAGSHGPLHETPYILEELECFLEGVNTRKLAFRGALAALAAAPLGGRKLTLALINCGRTWWITSNYSAGRQCGPLKKSGGLILHSLTCLRPVCQASDLAAAEDGLWIARNRDRLAGHWGPCQFGGLYEAQAQVLILSLLGQTRTAAGLPFIVNFSDEQFAFDVCPRDDIRLATYQAGVRGADWMVKDDQLRADHVRVAYKHLITDWAFPVAGIGQGRRGSVHDFNTAGTLLATKVGKYSSGASIPMSDLPYQTLEAASAGAPVAHEPYDKALCDTLALAVKAALSFPSSLPDIVANIRSEANRVSTLDLLSPYSVRLLQYVDDNAMPTASVPQSCAVWNCCETYTMEHGPQFKLGPNKSAFMANSHTFIPATGRPSYFATVVPNVQSYKYIGVLCDPDFTFAPHLKQAVGRWNQAFDNLYGICCSRRMPAPFIASIVPERVESVALHGIAFCIGVKSAETTLNRIQANWAKTLLGIKDYPQGLWPFLVAECRWPRRLGTKMLGEAIMLEARIRLLPDHTAAAGALLAARQSPFHSWAKLAQSLRHRLGQLPDILDWLCQEGVVFDHTDKKQRKYTARRFRHKVVYPALSQYDQEAYLKAERTSGWPYPNFQRRHDTFDDALLLAPWSPAQWTANRVWQLTRVSGRFPLPLLGLEIFPTTLETCPLCSRDNVNLQHILNDCAGSGALRKNLGFHNLDWPTLCVLLFSANDSAHCLGSLPDRVVFVYDCMYMVATGLQAIAGDIFD